MGDLTGGEIVARFLAVEKVRHVFGLPDGTYLPLLTGLRTQGIELITPRHETTAAHMAGAYARLTGTLGVCIASNGPGVANILPGVASENAEGNRVLLFTSSRRASIIQPDRGGTYQHFDQVAATRPMCKWAVSISRTDRLFELVERAVRESYNGRPGVVHVDVSEEVFAEKCGNRREPGPRPVARHHLHPDAAQVEQAAEMLVDARFPAIHAGGGVLHAGAGDALMKVARILHAPVLTSWSGRGSVAESSELVWPMTYVKCCTAVRNASDLVLCVGSRLGETDFWGKAPYWRSRESQSLIRVDVDGRSLDLNRPSDLAIQADAGLFLEELRRALMERADRIALDDRLRSVEPLLHEREKERARLEAKLSDLSVPMLTAHVPVACIRVFGEDAVAVFDGGNTAAWSQCFHTVRKPNTLLSTPHFGHLGAGTGQALGAAVARPESQVYCITGDGAFGFHLQEIETAVRHGLPVVFLVICDRQWGMVKMTQQFALKPVKTVVKRSLDAGETISTDLGEIRFDKLAESMGGHGERVSDPRELVPALQRCLHSSRCSVVHVDVDPVKHLWAPGLKDFRKMHEEPAGD